MKRIVFLLLPILFQNIAFSQAWEVLNTELKVERMDESLKISFMDDRSSISVTADTVYLDPELNLMISRKGNLFGIIDPWDLMEIKRPQYELIESLTPELMILLDEKGFFIVDKMDIEMELSGHFELIESFEHPYSGSVLDHIFLVEVDGKVGLIFPETYPMDFYLEPDFDEIVFSELSEAGPAFLIRKKEKWGVFACDKVFMEPAYESLEHLGGSCGGIYKAWKRGKCGLVHTLYSKPLIPFKYAEIYSVWGNGLLYLFPMKEMETPGGVILTDLDMDHLDWYTEYFLVTLPSGEKTYFVHRGYEGELQTQEVSLDWFEEYDGWFIEHLYLY